MPSNFFLRVSFFKFNNLTKIDNLKFEYKILTIAPEPRVEACDELSDLLWSAVILTGHAVHRQAGLDSKMSIISMNRVNFTSSLLR